eukprot:3176121-Pyramimonas_sp.AAC.1
MPPPGGGARGGTRLKMIKEGGPEGEVQRVKGGGARGLSRQHMPSDQMEYWLNRGWNEHQIRHWYSLRQAKRGDDDDIIRSKRGQTKSQEQMVVRDLNRVIIEDRKLYRGVCCTCPSYADQAGLPHETPITEP